MVQSLNDVRQRLAYLRATQTLLWKMLLRTNAYSESQVISDEYYAVSREILGIIKELHASASVGTR